MTTGERKWFHSTQIEIVDVERSRGKSENELTEGNVHGYGAKTNLNRSPTT